MIARFAFFVFSCEFVLTCVAVQVWADEPAGALEWVPRETLVLARASRLDEFDTSIQPLANNFGFALPALGQVVAQVEGVDPAGEAIVGITEYDTGVYLPFVLLPMSDYRAFVRAGDGDAGMDVTPLTLAGEELLAARRGQWALVTNVVDQFADLGRLDDRKVEQLLGEFADEWLTVAVTEAGLSVLKAISQSGPQSPQQLAHRRRLLSARPMNWRSLDDWQQRVTLEGDLVDQFHSLCSGVVLAIDADANLTTRMRAVFLPRGDVQAESAEFAQLPLELSDERTAATANCAWGSAWVDGLVQLYLSSFSTGSEELGVNYFRAGDFQRFRKSFISMAQPIQSAQFVMIAPASDQPTMSNSALVIQVADAKEFAKALDGVMHNWNRMIETAQRSVDYVFESKPLEIGDLAGQRYFIDLPTAFRDENIPEVRQVLADLYGRNGVWAVDVLPLDSTRVLVSDLPDNLRDTLIANLQSAQPAAEVVSANWTIRLDPAVLQDWLNDYRRHSYGENVIGWKPKVLESTSQVQIDLTTHAPTLTVTAEIPGDVVKALGKLIENNDR